MKTYIIILFLENVTAEDVQRVAKRFLQTPPSVAARGNIKEMPEYKDIQSGLLNPLGQMPNSKFHRFSRNLLWNR